MDEVMTTTIGFVGLGHMGNPMARNLLKAGISLYVYDVMPANVDALVAHGAKAAASIKELASHCDVVITMVQTSQQVTDICLQPDGIFQHLKSGALYIDCSSIDIEASQSLHAKAKELGIAMLDSPVSGGVAGAEGATLTFMVGGTEAHFKLAEPILQKMGKKIVHAGSAGHGQAAKICNNMLLAISMIGVCEAFSLAERIGLDAKKFYEISSNASGQCWSMTSYCPVPGILENVPSSKGYQAGFMAKMMLKDLRLAAHAAESVDAIIPLGEVATELYEMFVKEGHGDTDFSGIIKLLKKE
jgi:3-hydroxyisobutyrate dehydrogenase